MRIKIFGNINDFKSQNKEPKISKHTGIVLSSCSLTITVNESNKSKFEGFLEGVKTDGVLEVDESGNVLKVYNYLKSSYSYSSNNNGHDTAYTYTLDIEEREELNIEVLSIAGFDIKPYSYNEIFDGAALIITAKVKLSLEEKAGLKDSIKDKKYFTVIRKGINEESKQMRFGSVTWSDHLEFIKESITLVEEIYDKENKRPFSLFQPEMRNIQNILAFTSKYNELISDLLVSKGILLPEEINDLKEQAKKSMSLRDFYKVTDIDTFDE
jgi:hypothetical protein